MWPILFLELHGSFRKVEFVTYWLCDNTKNMLKKTRKQDRS